MKRAASLWTSQAMCRMGRRDTRGVNYPCRNPFQLRM
jgi:hypothetical protein